MTFKKTRGTDDCESMEVDIDPSFGQEEDELFQDCQESSC